ncbi:MAG: hypothetical protein IPQ26_09550 [Elusimicrobia bacterium]|nr:hypothetical protein [Elusimicrobiota bacterium]
MSYQDFRRAFCGIFTPMRAHLSLLRRLARRYPTALLSNTNPIHWAHMPRVPRPGPRAVSHGFTPFKEMKPAPVVYRRLARRTGFPLTKMVYIDDHPAFVAAAAVGRARPVFRWKDPVAPNAGPRGNRRLIS